MPNVLPVYLEDALFQVLYHRHHDHVERAVEHVLYEACDAQDVIWITWELAARKLVRFQTQDPLSGTRLILGEAGLRSWLWRTATFCARNYARAEWRREKLMERISEARVQQTEITDPESQGGGDQLIGCVLIAIEELSPKLRTLMEESLVDGLRPKEIAAKHDLKPAAVRTRLSRARRELEVRAREIDELRHR